ncbi:glycoside hydrolase superfamily [Dunaliella salina]|uniref:Glycoside hydrolase superfamily n=1 Tax=Dunaliella salina TaxID=3046 RepID=A0ABQ7GVM5_DUNSA|nr:glycoside hydrolase superfamily [Dunaliella salina]|eukprot:KAF5838653.1 glycoside hydrolase superfamily [Dunaliella salina]
MQNRILHLHVQRHLAFGIYGLSRLINGTATVWQEMHGNDSSNWSRFVHERWPFRWLGVSAFRGDFSMGEKGCDFWNRYKEDLGLAKNLGCTSFRFSFEWARIEPSQGSYDEAAIQRFHDILDTMEELGLEPNVTLHHFTHPTWFEDLGGFMKEENVPIFVEWAQFMFRTFHKRIKLWAIFNEPTAYTFLSFIVGLGPSPRYVSNIFNLIGAGRTLSNLLKAHTTTYWALKALPGGKEASIGMVHHHIIWVTEWLSYWLGWDIMDHWMCTGEFEWRLPVFGTWIKWTDPGGKPPCDWWGINFYSHPVAAWNLKPACLPHQIMTDMFYPIYPEGLYAAIQRSSRYGIPMYVTETGIADHRNDRRALLIETYFRVRSFIAMLLGQLKR